MVDCALGLLLGIIVMIILSKLHNYRRKQYYKMLDGYANKKKNEINNYFNSNGE